MKKWIAGLLGLGLINAAAAAPLDYQESVSGDISGQSFAFDIGTNTIRGSAAYFGVVPATDLDPFSFTLPQNSVLTSVTFAFQTAVTVDAVILETQYGLFGGNGFISSKSVNLLSGLPVSLFADALPHAEDGAPFFVTHTAGFLGDGGWWDYTLSFTVEAIPVAVPEPATLALLAAGVLGLGLRRRFA